MSRTTVVPLLLAAGIMLFAREAAAQNPRDVLIGGRTATMGGAGTAAGNDSAMPYLNPAGIAGLPNDVLAVSASVYAYSQSTFNGFFHPVGFAEGLGAVDIIDESVSSTSVLELPSSVMYVRHLGHIGRDVEHVAGLSLVIPVASRREIQASYRAHSTGIMGTIAETRALSESSTVYYIGPSYALSFGDKVRFGASAYAVYGRTVETTQLTSSVLPLGGSVPMGIRSVHSAEYESLSIAPIVGIQVQPIRRLWLGLGVAIPSFPISGNVTSSNTRSGTTADVATSQPIAFEEAESFEGNRKVGKPLRINAGVAWEDPGTWAAAADVHWYADRSGASKTDGLAHLSRVRTSETARGFDQDISTSLDVTSVVDISVGGEVWLSRIFSVRAGFMTDFADTPELAETSDVGEIYRQRLDRYGATLGLGIKAGSFDSSVGAFAWRGTGKFVVPDTTGEAAQAAPTTSHAVPIDMTTTTVGLILSTAVSTDEARSTIQNAIPGG